jgi:hypothetical protein
MFKELGKKWGELCICIGMGHDLSLMGRVMLFEFLVFWDGM